MNAKGRLWMVAGSVVLVLLFTTAPSQGCYDRVSLASLAQQSDVVVTGRVVAITAQRDMIQAAYFGIQGEEIEVVSVDLSVSEVLKGGRTHGSLTLTVLRGRDGIPMWPLEYFPTFTIGEEVCVFLTRLPGDQVLMPTEGFQGKFTFQAETVVENGRAREVFLVVNHINF